MSRPSSPRPTSAAPATPSSDQSSNGGRLLTPEQVAERWGVKRSQVYRLTREGQLPTVAIGRYYRYRLADLDMWEQNGGAGL